MQNKISRFKILFLIATLTPLITGTIPALLVFYHTYTQELSKLDFCISSKCIENWINANSTSLLILEKTCETTLAIVTITGIYAALYSYINNTRASSISNHLSHITIFSNYLNLEISRHERISNKAIEPMKLYNLIYKDSINGSLKISDEYREFIQNINRQISESNSNYNPSKNNSSNEYKYKNHQTRMIEILEKAGIYLERLPRIDFNEVESQVFEIIKAINLSFCKNTTIPEITKKTYN